MHFGLSLLRRLGVRMVCISLVTSFPLSYQSSRNKRYANQPVTVSCMLPLDGMSLSTELI